MKNNELYTKFSTGKKPNGDDFKELIDHDPIFEESSLAGGGLKVPTNNRIHLATNKKWVRSEGHLSDLIRLQWLPTVDNKNNAKPALVWCDEHGDDKTAIISHYEANDSNQADHVHLSIETSKLDGSLHTRMEFPFDTETCEIQTWGSNFTVNGTSRVAGSKNSARDFTFATAGKKLESLDENGRIIPDTLYSKRWTLRANDTSETGSQIGSDFELVRYKDDGSPIDTAIFVKRSNGNVGIKTRDPQRPLDINGNVIRLRTPKTPDSSTAFGYVGDICWDTDYIYICVASDTWKRTKIDTW